MPLDQITFQDGAGYETMMGIWSRIVGEEFLGWLSPTAAQKWLDVGCGNGAFTELLVANCAVESVRGIDPSEEQIAYARGRGLDEVAIFDIGDAMALPYGDATFDAAVSALVIFFMPDPERGVREMARCVEPGGSISSYAWDLLGGGFPYEPVHAQMRKVGLAALLPPHPEAANLDELGRLWSAAGLVDIETRVIDVVRAYDTFDDYWKSSIMSPRIQNALHGIPVDKVDAVKASLREELKFEPGNPLPISARAHAIKGRKPA